MFLRSKSFSKIETSGWPIPNYWDLIALILVIGIIVLLGWGTQAMLGKYHPGLVVPISLNPWHLPYYALRTFLRMIFALCFSLLFTFIFATWAAKSRHAERLIIPFIDVMQSVPVLGFLSISVTVFIVLCRGSMLGPELAAIFAIFTAQVWNMALSFYQSLRTVPREMHEAAKMFQLSPWQTFWRVEVPFAMPGLLWNTMISMSSSWIFLVASEAITVAHHTISLPGIGSYIALAIEHRDLHAILYVIITMLIVIALYDQLMFRPLIAWAEKFKTGDTASEEEPESWVLYLFQRTHFLSFIGKFFVRFGNAFVNFKPLKVPKARKTYQPKPWVRYVTLALWYVVVTALLLWLLWIIGTYIFHNIPFVDTGHVFYLGLVSALRIGVILIICALIWVPIGVWIGLNPKATKIVQPIVQFLAAFPANLLFPLVVLAIVRYHLNANIWTSPLMMLGTQWFILFNVIAGTSVLPKNLHYAVGTLNVRGWLWWRRFILPGIFPYLITGLITAAGGAWNYTIIVEAVSWGHYQIYATGLGAYITKAYNVGNFPELALGIVVMSLFVLIINRLIWRPLYNLAQEKFMVK